MGGGADSTSGGSSAWFGEERADALADFWAIYDANVRLGPIMRSSIEAPALAGIAADTLGPGDENAARLREILRAAIAGDWPPYEAALRRLGATYAEQGFTGWRSLSTMFSRRLIPVAVRTHAGDPERLTAVLLVISEFLDRVARTLEDAYLKKKDALARDSEERHRMLFESSPVPMFVVADVSHAFLAVNDAALALYGHSRDELLAMRLSDVVVDASDIVFSARGETVSRAARSHRRHDGSVLRVDITARPIELDGHAGRLVVAIDVTEKANLEAQLRQSQKMEAIGSLAGGVAHDFNNLLSVILGYSELVANDLHPQDPRRADLEQIKSAGVRASGLTRQLLAFSRRQVLQPKTVNLNEIVVGIGSMLQRLIGEDVELVIIADRTVGAVLVDPGQIEQVIVNLAVNARDAMPRGGKLTIETAEVDLDDAYVAEHVGSRAGRHVMLAFSDNGDGMSRDTQARIFEPFFTTKEVGKGTGLGLSTVFGIVRQSGGTIWVYSEVAKGTTFKLYFPLVTAAPSVQPSVPVSLDRVPARGSETVLLVEDDVALRSLARTILERAGYHVLEGESGAEAVAIAAEHGEAIHLLLTDVVMPHMSGREVAAKVVESHPGVRVLYMSGYTDDSIVRHGILDSTIDFLQKPITAESLTRKVREVLDAPRRAAEARSPA